MIIHWTVEARSDLVRLEEFLRPKSSRAAARVVQMLIAAPMRLLDHPRVGERLEGAGNVELRRLFVDHYEIQYEVRQDEVRIARVFHMLEDR